MLVLLDYTDCSPGAGDEADDDRIKLWQENDRVGSIAL